MSRARLAVLVVFLIMLANSCQTPTASSIALDSHFAYIVVGGDHVAESVARYLSARDSNKTVLVLKGNRCNDVLEPSEPSKLWLEVSYLFAESAHYLGYEFIDPFLHGSKPGIAFTNQTSSFIPPLQQLYAVDPNLKMLTDARPQRIIYNKASSTALGVEVVINFNTQYIFAKEEVIVAGRCVEDYQLLSQAEILLENELTELLHKIPLEIAMKSPIIAPIFALHPNSEIVHESTKQPYCLLATELFIETLSKADGDRTVNSRQGIQPNAKVNIIVKEQASDRWIGFNPSVIYQETSMELSDHATMLNVLMDTIDLCMKLGSSETFRKLGLSFQPHQIPPSVAYNCPQDHVDNVLCFVNHTLSAAYKTDEDLPASEYLPFVIEHLAEDFHLKTSRNVRVLPFGLTSPFLDHWWKRIFSRRLVVREYTTRTGILSANQTQVNPAFSMDALMEKLRERLKAIGNIPQRH